MTNWTNATRFNQVNDKRKPAHKTANKTKVTELFYQMNSLFSRTESKSERRIALNQIQASNFGPMRTKEPLTILYEF